MSALFAVHWQIKLIWRLVGIDLDEIYEFKYFYCFFSVNVFKRLVVNINLYAAFYKVGEYHQLKRYIGK